MLMVFASLLPALGITVIVNDDGGNEKSYSDGEYADASLYSSGSFTYDGGSVDTVNVSWRKGNVEVIQKKGDSLSVSESGKGLSEAESLHYLIKDRTLYIQFTQSGYDYTGRIDDKNLTLEIPGDVNLHVGTETGDITSSSLDVGTLSLSTASGRIDAGCVECDGNAYFTTSTGDVSVSSLEGESVYFTSSSGNLTVGEIDGDSLYFTTSSGNITLSRSDFESASFSTSTGDISLSNAECDKLSISTSNGDVALNNVDVTGKFNLTGSSAECGFTNLNVMELDAVLSSGALRAHNLRVDRIDLDTSSGDVELSLMSDVKGEINTSSGNVSISRLQKNTKVIWQGKGTLTTGLETSTKDGKTEIGRGGYTLSVTSTSGSLSVD